MNRSTHSWSGKARTSALAGFATIAMACTSAAPPADPNTSDGNGPSNEPAAGGAGADDPGPTGSENPAAPDDSQGPDEPSPAPDSSPGNPPAVGPDPGPDDADDDVFMEDDEEDILLPDDELGEELPPGIYPGDKVDLLFVVDNSTSMGDKQAIFSAAIPDLIELLVTPPCIQEGGGFLDRGEDGLCPSGSARAFAPVEDMHIAVLSSSLGDHGLGPDQSADNPICPSDVVEQNDRAHLIGLMRGEQVQAESYEGLGFLVWDAEQTHSPPGDADQAALAAKFQAQVNAVREDGCGFEAPLESAYRFLVDPEPYQTLERAPCTDADENNSCVVPSGIDTELLAQRNAFLRPDSALVVLYLTDENDCSVRDSRQGYYTLRLQRALDGASTPLAKGTLACETDPNSECCRSCAAQVPAGCDPAPANGCDDSAEPREANGKLSESFNLRCYDQKRRFGIDFLYSTERYLAGFQNNRVQNRAGTEDGSPNPLFFRDDGTGTWVESGRRKNQVFVVGIVGTPWQDLAVDVNDPNGEVERAAELDWSLFLPINGAAAPSDPFNMESIEPRSGENPVTGEELGGMETWNSINGHERAIPSGDGLLDDLQYSCTFPLEPPRDCAGPDADPTKCDCTVGPSPVDPEVIDDYATGNPLCRDPETGDYGTTQYFAKAYPSPRVMEVVRGMGAQGVLGSICPKNATDDSQLDFGYRPPIRALLLGLSPGVAR